VLLRSLKRQLTQAYLAGCGGIVDLLLCRRSGARDFRRIAVVAALGRANGIACGARLQWEALRELGVDAELIDATPALRNPLFRAAHRPASAYVFHSGGPQMANLILSVLPHAAVGYRIAYWAWELPDPPPGWTGCDRQVAEIWTPSAFSKSSLTQLSSRPVHVVPHHISAKSPRHRRTAAQFTVLAMADSRSSLSRKNPEGALRAFHAAFGDSRAARLVLKLSGRSDELRELKELLAPLLCQPNVTLLTEYLDQARLDALYREVDVQLSLHRGEGFGLPLREAMAHGVPVVATGWSGNLDFMDRSNSCLVPYRLVPVHDQSAIYSGSRWAEPDINAAAQALRRLADDPEEYERLAAAAYASVAHARPSFPFSDVDVPVRAAVAAE